MLNKFDTIDDEGEIPEVLKDYQIFKVSAKKYLAGVIADDKKRIQDSHFLEFKENFENYLNSLDVLNVKKERIERLLDDILRVGIFQLDEVIKNFSLSKEELENKLNFLKTELKEKEIIVEKVLSEIDKKEKELKNFIDIELNILKHNLKKANSREEIIELFENFVIKIKEKTVLLFNTTVNDYELDLSFIDELFLFISDLLSGIKNTLEYLLENFLEKKEINIKIKDKLEIFSIIGKNLKGWKVNSTIDENIKSLKINLQNEIERIANEEKQNLEFKELAEIKASIYAIGTSKKELENQKENIETKISYLTQQKNNLQSLISKCKEELC